MQMILLHGRRDPSEEMSGWGFDGPTLAGTVALHVTYNSTFALYFESAEAARIARDATGWRHWDDSALEVAFHEDMVRTVDSDGFAYFGDWELQVRQGNGEVIARERSRRCADSVRVRLLRRTKRERNHYE